MAESRLRRLIGGLGVGYLHTVVVVGVGLWLTPYLLRNLGSRDYGLWILGAQVLTYLGLLDLGVVALVPRDVAATVGGTLDGEREQALQRIVGQTLRIVLVQLPLVAVAGAVAVWLVPSAWGPLRWPLALIVAGFVATFPLRVFSALLQGLQDLTVFGAIHLVAWVAGTAMTVACVAAGAGLYSLVGGWILTQVISAYAAWRRIRQAFPEVMPTRIPAVSLAAVRQQVRNGAWVTVHQVAQVLLAGTDLLVVGRILGPEAVVTYVCTGKLVALLANQPQLFMQMALPALSELRGSASRQRLVDLSTSMSQALLLASGAVAVVVLAINAPFVRWWVGDTAFGGMGLTAVMLAGMILRHVNLTAVYTLFCFGDERRVALTSAADGVCTVIVMVMLVPHLGLYGAALGPVVGAVVVSLPCNAWALARAEGLSVADFVRPLGPWLFRFAMIIVAVATIVTVVRSPGAWEALALAVGVVAAYAVIMRPVLRTPPLATLVAERLLPRLAGAPSWSRRLLSGFVPEVTRV